MEAALLAALGLLAIIAYLVWRERSPREKPRERWFAPQKVVKSERPKAPLTGSCAACGDKVTMPYKCKYCGGVFCDDHRLPENHGCDGIRGLRREKTG